MPKPVVVLLDGLRRTDPDEPVLRVDDLGVLRGESVFETVRIAGGRAAYLDAHLARLSRSAERLAMDLPPGWSELATAACEGWTDGVLRLVCTKGPACRPGVGFALVTEVPADAVAGRQGVTAVTLTLGVGAAQREQAPWLLGGVKSTSYAVNMASLRHAGDLGADDVIWLSSDAEVLEAPTSTVVLVRDGVLVTPPTSVGILAGTTLQAVLDLRLAPAQVRRIPSAELAAADEVLLLSSIRGVAPVLRLDDRELGLGPLGALLPGALEAALQS